MRTGNRREESFFLSYEKERDSYPSIITRSEREKREEEEEEDRRQSFFVFVFVFLFMAAISRSHVVSTCSHRLPLYVASAILYMKILFLVYLYINILFFNILMHE